MIKIINLFISFIEKIRYYYGRIYVRHLISKLGSYKKSDISYPIIIKSPNNVFISNNVKIGPNCTFGAFNKIYIGSSSRISSNCIIETATLDLYKRDFGFHKGKDIVIGNNVWIGAGCTILGGTIIGDNSFVHAGSIVSSNIPKNSIFKENKIKTRIYE
jgi:acetyltransferase-like isoleucine patch superfamily enzyme